LIPPFSLISYITIYILISYIVFRKGCRYLFLIGRTGIGRNLWSRLFTHFLLYKAFQRFAEFAGHAPDIAREVEASAANLLAAEVPVRPFCSKNIGVANYDGRSKRQAFFLFGFAFTDASARLSGFPFNPFVVF